MRGDQIIHVFICEALAVLFIVAYRRVGGSLGSDAPGFLCSRQSPMALCVREVLARPWQGRAPGSLHGCGQRDLSIRHTPSFRSVAESAIQDLGLTILFGEREASSQSSRFTRVFVQGAPQHILRRPLPQMPEQTYDSSDM